MIRWKAWGQTEADAPIERGERVAASEVVARLYLRSEEYVLSAAPWRQAFVAVRDHNGARTGEA